MVMMLLEDCLFIQRIRSFCFRLFHHYIEIREENFVSVAGPESTRADALHSHGNTMMGIQPVKLTYTKAKRDLRREVQVRVFTAHSQYVQKFKYVPFQFECHLNRILF